VDKKHTAPDGLRPEPRRQARGQARIAQILEAAAVVFARDGYEAATTVKISAEARISPGSLYQFFANKEAIAQALAAQFVDQLRAAHQEAFDATDFAALPIDELLDRVVDPIVAFNIANPGFKALFARPDMPADLTDAARPIHEAMFGRLDSMIAARAPGLTPLERALTARIAIQVFQAIIPTVVAAEPPHREAAVRELKKVLRGYLAPVIGNPPRPSA
jgi:AcrR family transcriptional regulator